MLNYWHSPRELREAIAKGAVETARLAVEEMQGAYLRSNNSRLRGRIFRALRGVATEPTAVPEVHRAALWELAKRYTPPRRAPTPRMSRRPV